MSGIKNRWNAVIGKTFLSLFGVGFSPIAPGTVGSAVSVLILIAFNQVLPLDFVYRGAFLALLFTIVFLISTYWVRICTSPKNHDEQWIVIDEFLGMLISAIPLFFIEKAWYWWLIAFGLFRFFDIVKPLGIRKIDRSKYTVAVLVDDVVAGIYAVCILMALLFLF